MNAKAVFSCLISAGGLWAAIAAGPAPSEPPPEGGADRPRHEVRIGLAAAFRTIQSNG